MCPQQWAGEQTSNVLVAYCAMELQSFKLTGVLTIGNEMAVGPKAILQILPPFAVGVLLVFLFLFFLLFFFIITSHILNALGKERMGRE